MTDENTRYGLRHRKTGNLIGFYTTSNEGADFCNDSTYTLCEHSNKTWLVQDPKHAEYVRNFSTPWYNASYDSPQHSFEAEELEVVEYKVELKPVEVKIPTVKEYLKLQYAKRDPEHYEYVLKELESGADITYSLYDLSSLDGHKIKY